MIHDSSLDAILRALAREKHVPAGWLIMRTKAAVRGRRLLQVVIFSSIVAQLVTLGFIIVLLAAPGVPIEARICGLIALFGYGGCIVIAAVAARRTVVSFFEKVERLTA